ncbi:MAG: MgtC/SapB family protein [Nitrospirota bacterium]
MEFFDAQEALAEFGKLILAALLGGAVGFEREAHGQAAGIRTNILVSVGACLLMMLSLHMEEIFRHLDVDSVVRLDPARIASYAVASMGFLGAGAIIKGKGSIRGLTTAAGLWLITGIGLAIGAGYLWPAVSAAVLSLLILYFLRRIKIFLGRDTYTVLTLKFRGIEGRIDEIKKIFSEYPEITIQFINIYQRLSPQTLKYRIRLQSKELLNRLAIMERFLRLHEIEEVSWEEGIVP